MMNECPLCGFSIRDPSYMLGYLPLDFIEISYAFKKRLNTIGLRVRRWFYRIRTRKLYLTKQQEKEFRY